MSSQGEGPSSSQKLNPDYAPPENAQESSNHCDISSESCSITETERIILKTLLRQYAEKSGVSYVHATAEGFPELAGTTKQKKAHTIRSLMKSMTYVLAPDGANELQEIVIA